MDVRRLLAWVAVCSVIALGSAIGLSFAADSPSPWVASAPPTLRKVADMPDDVPPATRNIDCDIITTRMAYSRLMQEACVVQTPLGLAAPNGIIFNGGSELVPVTAKSPFVGLRPVPNQPLWYSTSSAPVYGVKLGFYTSIRDKMNPLPTLIDGGYQYVLTKSPDFILRDLQGVTQPVDSNSIAFSPNGNWMVVDYYGRGLVRVNMATFEIMPFANSVHMGSPSYRQLAYMAISNDGRYVAAYPNPWNVLKVYDLATCTKAVMPYDQAQAQCQSRDYWPELSAAMPGLKALYQLRFTGSMQLSLVGQYEYSVGSYKVAQYSLTAPGVSPYGIEYLGMGDSYASGQGAFNYIAGTDTADNRCHLSSLSYPFLLSSVLFSSGHSVACSGAKTHDINSNSESYSGQNQPKRTVTELGKLNLLSPILQNFSPGYILQSEFLDKHNPQSVTLSIGGNDIRFADIVKRCVSPKLFDNTCYPTKEDQQELADSITGAQGKLQSTYRPLKAPNRKVYIIGYPQIVAAGGDCANNVHLNDKEIRMFISLTDLLNQTIQAAAAKAEVQYVDVSDAFAGHRMCETRSSNVAVNGVTAGNDEGFGKMKLIGNESFHPNALGHELLRHAILRKTGGLKAYAAASPIIPQPMLPHADAPSTGRTLNVLIPEDDLVPRIIAPLKPVPLQINTALQLKSSSQFSVRIDGNPEPLAAAATDAAGILTGTVTLPADTACGPHLLHVYGQNVASQPVDIYKEIYVDSETGCSDPVSSCGVIAASGNDVDRDGIDDACDPIIADPPSAARTHTVFLTSSSIHAVQGAASATSESPAQPSSLAVPSAAVAAKTAEKTRKSAQNYLTVLLLATACAALGWIYIKSPQLR